MRNSAKSIHPTLRRDCEVIGRFALCHLLLMKDTRYPWLVLVPGRPDITEIYQLSESDQNQLLRESALLANILMTGFSAEKLNIAALGNVVPQLHVHHIARYKNDPVWPRPVWGALPPKPYSQQALDDVMQKVKSLLPEDFQYY